MVAFSEKCTDTSIEGCEDAYTTYQALQQEEAEIYVEIYDLEKELQALVALEQELIADAKEFCEDPGDLEVEFEEECLALV